MMNMGEEDQSEAGYLPQTDAEAGHLSEIDGGDCLPDDVWELVLWTPGKSVRKINPGPGANGAVRKDGRRGLGEGDRDNRRGDRKDHDERR